MTRAIWLGAVLAILTAGAARADWTADDLSARLGVRSGGEGSATVKVFQGEGQLFAVAVLYDGPGLPAEKSLVLELDPPASERFVSHHVLTRLAGNFDPYWSEPRWGRRLTELHDQTIFVLWRAPDGSWGAMIPLVGGGMQSRLAGRGVKVVVEAESLMPGYAPSLAPMLAIGFGENPYRLIRDLYSFALAQMRELSPGTVLGRPRWEKPYPDIFRYVGWCSWNAYYADVDEDKLLASAQEFKDAGFPLRYLLIDDRWMQVERTTPVWNNGRNLSLSALEADPAKFPNGIGHTVELLKKEFGIGWVGVWMTFQGYWNGLLTDSPMARDLGDALMAVSDQVSMPDPHASGKTFYDAWFEYLEGEGIDFIKVDNQSTTANYYRGRLPVTDINSGLHRALETAAMKRFGTNVLDCMSLNVDAIYQWPETNLARASIDTWPRQRLDPRHHAVETVMNSLWLSNLAWPDYDMWQTHAPHNDYHIIGRAISGGPLYVADEPGRLNVAPIWPLIYSDGEVIRADEPGLPAFRTLVNSPYQSGEPLVAFARAGAGGALAVWNVDHLMRPVRAELSPAEVEGIEGERFAVYDYFEKKLRVLDRDEKFPVRLGAWGVGFYTVIPEIDGFAALGLLNKYLAAATVLSANIKNGALTVKLRESGPFGAYCRERPTKVTVNGQAAAPESLSYEDRLLLVNLPERAGETIIEIEKDREKSAN